MTRTHWNRTAILAWTVLLAAVCIKPLIKPTSGTVYVTYAMAGVDFAAGQRLYDNPHPFADNYRYSPLVAAGFVPLSVLPLGIGGMVWRLLGAAVFLTGLAAWARRVCPDVPLSGIFLLAIPLSLNSLNNGQANTLVLGLMLWGTLLASRNWWAAGAVLIAAAGLFKGYPLALGGLIALAAPIRFGLPLLAAVAAGAALPYVFQSPEYVSAQYQYWQENLARDDRTALPLYAGLQDFHMLLRVVGLEIPLDPYRLVQAGTGALVALLLARQLWSGLHRREVVLNAFTFGVCWMIVFGPVVETATFIILAPVMAREILDDRSRPRWAKVAAILGAGCFAIALCALAFPHAIHRPVIALGVQPLGALLVSSAAIGRVLMSRPAEPVTTANEQPVELRRAA
jgi:hypothetical protein